MARRQPEAGGDQRRARVEPAVIVPYEDGPYLVRGGFVIRDQNGEELELTRRTVALCRCGRSRMRPLCDGTHRAIRFRCPGVAERWPADAGDAAGVPDAAPAAEDATPVSTAAEALSAAERAHIALLVSLDASCDAGDQLAMRLAEPLVAAACSLLRWQAGECGSLDHAEPVPAAGIEGARAHVGAAMRAVIRLPSGPNDARETQLRSLLRDAAAALRAGGRAGGVER
jgi:CDGSH-type Zn-finger protein